MANLNYQNRASSVDDDGKITGKENERLAAEYAASVGKTVEEVAAETALERAAALEVRNIQRSALDVAWEAWQENKNEANWAAVTAARANLS